MRRWGTWGLAVLWLVAACAPRRTPKTPAPAAPPSTTVRDTSGGGLQETPPLEERSEPIIIFEEEPTPPAPPAQDTGAATAPTRIPVFRVQVFAASSRQKAEIIAQELREIQKEPVVIEEEEGLFKVRVGAFPSRLLAESYRDFLRTKGYPDAFVVEVQPGP